MKKRNHNAYKLCFTVAFLLSLVLPVGTMKTSDESRPEGRKLASAPLLIVNGTLNTNLATETEAWLRDQAGSRDFFLWAGSRAEAAMGGWESDMALRGKDGWLFLRATIGSFYNQNLFSQQELEQIRDGIRKKQAMLKAEGVDQYYLLICPDKNRLYGEDFYPAYVRGAGPIGKKSRAQQLVEYLRDCGDINVVYPLDAMLAEKKAHPDHILYYRTDTHWNTHGAFIAYKELMKVIQKDYPNLQVLTDKDFALGKTDPEPGCDPEINGAGDEGDLLRMFNGRTIDELGIKDNYVDKLIPREGLFKHKYPKFSGPAGEKGIVSCNDAVNQPISAVMYRDSFGKAIVPYLAETFSKAEFVWTHRFGQRFGAVKRNKPNIVIEQIVERSIDLLKTNAATE